MIRNIGELIHRIRDVILDPTQSGPFIVEIKDRNGHLSRLEFDPARSVSESNEASHSNEEQLVATESVDEAHIVSQPTESQFIVSESIETEPVVSPRSESQANVSAPDSMEVEDDFKDVNETESDVAEAMVNLSKPSRNKRRLYQKKRSASQMNQPVEKKNQEIEIEDSYSSDSAIEIEPEQAINQLTKKLKSNYVLVDKNVASNASILEVVNQTITSSSDKLDIKLVEHIDELINTSVAQKMIGYFLRGKLAYDLRESCRNYNALARTLLGIKSPSDRVALPAFYSLVMKHCPLVADAVNNNCVTQQVVERWLSLPVFHVDIGWREWRNWLSGPRFQTTDVAVGRFLIEMEPLCDWMEKKWIEIYDTTTIGQGIRALRDINLSENQTVVLDLAIIDESLFINDVSELEEDWLFEIEQGVFFNTKDHWFGKINHLPFEQSNVKISGRKLIQIKDIKAGDALTIDYGWQYWIRKIGGIPYHMFTEDVDPSAKVNSRPARRAKNEAERLIADQAMRDNIRASDDSVRKNRICAFSNMNELVEDYTEILQFNKLHNDSTYGQREEFVGNLIIHLEERYNVKFD
jgi:hypothetical protein